MQAFEKYKALSNHIERMACTGDTGGINEWSKFLSDLNTCLMVLESRITELRQRERVMVTKEDVEKAKFAADVAVDILIIAGVADKDAAVAAADAAWDKYIKLRQEFKNGN